MYINELKHYGIKGMKWGVRRYQNPDGTLTAKGRQRYSSDVDGAKEDLKNKVRAYKDIVRKNRLKIDSESYDEYKRAKRSVEVAKIKLKDETTKQKINQQKKVSKRQEKFTKKYIEKGLTEEEAAIQAYRRVKTEKVLAAVGGLTVAALAGYAIYKYRDNTFDRLIPKGTELQRISSNNLLGVKDSFYAAMNNSDKALYRSVFGKFINDKGETPFIKKLQVNSNMRIASEKNALKAFKDLLTQDKQYADTLKSHLKTYKKQNFIFTPEVVLRGIKSLEEGKITKDVYEAMNISIASRGLKTSDYINNGFFSKLKSLGYEGVIDLFDKKHNSMNAKAPLIVFDKAKVTVDSVKELSKEEITKAANSDNVKTLLTDFAPLIALSVVPSVLVERGKNKVKTIINNKKVTQYRKEHPNTKQSYYEILERIE